MKIGCGGVGGGIVKKSRENFVASSQSVFFLVTATKATSIADDDSHIGSE